MNLIKTLLSNIDDDIRFERMLDKLYDEGIKDKELYKEAKEYVLDPNICTSKKQAEKLIAINKLMNVAKYLNGDWCPNWNEGNPKYFISIDHYKNIIAVDCNIDYAYNTIYFKSKELAQQAIEILGEETIKTALSTDW